MNVITRAEWRWVAIHAAVLVAIASLPYLIAYLATPEDLFYTGFLSNPEDGQSYLAKMREGAHGDWLFHLPFTPEPHRGEFLFTYYLALGHLARWAGLPLILVFHLARIVNGFLLLLILYDAAACFFSDIGLRRFAFTITAVGSGLGWLAMFAGLMTADMWVPEGYVFYSLFVNPHFPLAIALTWLLFRFSVVPWGDQRISLTRLGGLLAAAAALGAVLPFALLTVGLVLALYALALGIQRRCVPWRTLASGAAIAVTGLPFVLNAYLATARNPAFAAWSAQNQTPSPPLWDYAVSYGLILALALGGLWTAAWRRRNSDWLVAAWALCIGALLYVPFSLQRRFVTGWIVPLGILAAMGWIALSERRPRLRAEVVWAIAGLTNLVLIVITLFGALTHNEALFITADEHAALSWMADTLPPDALVIAAPSTGLYIPAWAGQRVFYGHRFETIHADLRQAQLRAFFQEGDRLLLDQAPPLRPDYVFYGPRERALSSSGWQPDPAWEPVYRNKTVTVYALRGK